jgi:hypothetical protein
MIERRGLRRLAAAGALSVVAHAALLGGGWLMPPQTPPAAPALSAALQPASPAPRATVPPPARGVATRPAAANASANVTANTVTANAASTAPPTNAGTESPPGVTEGTDTAAPAAVVATTNRPPVPAEIPAQPLWPEFPRRGQISYRLSLGPEQTPVGRTVQAWAFDGARYRLDSRSESSGLVEMIRPHRYVHLSEGRLTATGLQPERFSASVRRGNRNEASIAAFDWAAQRVQLGRLPHQDSVELLPGSQDVVSLIYQLALFPPQPGRISLPFTRGTRMEQANFDVLEAEAIDTPLGRLRAVPVIQVRERGAESLALWFATDYRNLPVRIRFFNRDGELSGEQLASEILIAER